MRMITCGKRDEIRPSKEPVIVFQLSDHSRSEFFKKNPAVLKNPQTHGAASWLALDDCLWNAPHYMKSKTPLKSIYLANRPESKERVLSEFFELTLQIQDATFENFIDELILMRDSESNPTGIAFGNVQDIYCHLDKMRLLNDKDGVSIR
jgi:hypothetical protein